MQYGLALYNSGDYEGALKQYTRGQQLAPSNDLFFNRAGLCLFKLKRTAEAVAQVEQALALQSDPLYYYNLGIGYEELGDAAKAEQYYKDGLTKYPQDSDLLANYGALLENQGRGAEALEKLQQAAKQSGSAALYGQAAVQAAKQGNVPLAVELYSNALQLNPGDGQSNVEYALLLAGNNRDAELDSLLAGAAKQLSAEDLGWLVDELGTYWIDQQQYDKGKAYMEKLIGLAPRQPVSYNGLAMFEHLLGNPQQALAAVKRGLNDAGESYFGRYLEVYFTYTANGADAALPLAEGLLALPDAGADAYSLYLQMLAEKRDNARIIDVGRRGLQAFPQSAEILGYVAQALADSGEPTGVISLLTDPAYSALELASRDALLGRAYLAAGNYAKASAHLTSATQAVADDAGLWADAGRALYFAGDAKGAREALTRALALDATLVEPQLWLGLALLQQGDTAGAQSALSALANSPYLPAPLTGWLALAQARLALATGDRASAAVQFDAAQAAAGSDPELAAAVAKARQEGGL